MCYTDEMFPYRARFHVAHLSHRSFKCTVLWAVGVSTLIVVAISALARAAHNFEIALTDKPDIALYLLLPEEGITSSELLRESEHERDYLTETNEGPKLVKLKKDGTQWRATLVESLHED